MQSSPPQSMDGKARAIRELSASRNLSARSISSVENPSTESNPTKNLSGGSWFNDDVLASTQFNDFGETDTNANLPVYSKIRSTAKKNTSWQPVHSEPLNPDTSMVNKEFGDFDGQSISDDEDVSVEAARGNQRSNRNTPTKDSLYHMTPLSSRSRRSLGPETGSLRRDAQLRRASKGHLDMTASPRPASTRHSPAVSGKERRHASLAQVHAKLSEEESSLFDVRPDATISHSKSSRWGNARNRNNAPQVDGMVDNSSSAMRTPRSRPGTATHNPTAQSFVLPDLPNLTELVSGVFADGTPVFSKDAAARTRFANNNNDNGRPSNFNKINGVALPSEEKAIFSALQLLQDKVAEMEHERAETDLKMEERAQEIDRLRAMVEAQEARRQTDSALGSTDGESSGRSSWKIEKSRLEATVTTLRTKLDRTERKISVVEIEKKRLSAERDNMASQLGVAFQTCEELKAEKGVLDSENEQLREENDSLRVEIDALHEQMDEEMAQYREETVQLRRQADQTENATQQQNATLQAELSRVRSQHDQLRRQADQTDNATRRQNLNLQAELARVRADHDENTQQLNRKDMELQKARQEQAEHARLKADHDALKAQLKNLKAKRENDLRQWAENEAAMKARVERRDETIRHFRDMTQEHTSEAIRHDNDQLRQELAELTAQHEKDLQRWLQKEKTLSRQVNNAKEVSDMTREILSIRQPSNQQTNAHVAATAKEKNASRRREEDSHARVWSGTQEESRIRRVNVPSQSSRSNKIPRKSYTDNSRVSLPTGYTRSVSSPVPRQTAEVESEVESTTDISLAPRHRDLSYSMSGAASGKPAANVQAPPDLDFTQLSWIDSSDIARLRRQLEEERLAARGRAVSVPLERNTVRSEREAFDNTQRSGRQPREDTIRSILSEKSVRQSSVPRKSSMKDTTNTKTNGTQFEEELTGNISNIDNTDADVSNARDALIDASMSSNTGRRRRSAPTEMTSAFIVPDLKIDSRKQVPLKIDLSQKIHSKSHDNDNCTVCRQNAPDDSAEPLRVPKLTPVSSRMPDDVDATLRPARSPAEALALVVKGLCDERAHLHIDLAVMRAMLEAHDPSLGRRKRVSIEQNIAELLVKIKAKDEHIYNLHDVLEGQKEEDITEQFVEDVTERVRKEAEEQQAGNNDKKKGKKVTIQSFHEDEESADDDLPWEGFEDTGDREFTADLGRVGVF
ncbi:unnamed protein product [Periconia digitata]|uniref:Cep57 centrosome microtubule-binding domain-containing protein n=1 Tax=Periconia digitata TaxID=1303443 RepID=A0A9W4UAK6_9PLEO|nr:unnamed protein product [Periconia digitata]